MISLKLSAPEDALTVGPSGSTLPYIVKPSIVTFEALTSMAGLYEVT
ncbi:MAG: hypothetical protein J7L20_04600 [Thermoplasmata archaeon]|nr:hypothetical protein [Thermoplasmata archaeon]